MQLCVNIELDLHAQRLIAEFIERLTININKHLILAVVQAKEALIFTLSQNDYSFDGIFLKHHILKKYRFNY